MKKISAGKNARIPMKGIKIRDTIMAIVMGRNQDTYDGSSGAPLNRSEQAPSKRSLPI